MVSLKQLGEQTGIKFGTSGVRGLVVDMTDYVCFAYTTAFLQRVTDLGQLVAGGRVMVAGDLRSSTPHIKRAIMAAIKAFGAEPVDCGLIPTPAVAFYAMQNQAPSIMVTGSHIPEDRNGIKYYRADGEILKADEAAILAYTFSADSRFSVEGNLLASAPQPQACDQAYRVFLQRYTKVFAADALKGKRIGIYQHSTVIRDMLVEVVEALGGEAIALARANEFISVDTEAIRPEDVVLAKRWADQYLDQGTPLDAILSADGDGDRPLIADEHGEWLRGDVLGILVSQYLQINQLAVPVSCNTAVDICGDFSVVERTKIGSPYVIAAMEDLSGRVAGYEANGGYLLASELRLNQQVLAALPTRDALLPMLAVMLHAFTQGKTLSQLQSDLPSRFTLSDRNKAFPTEVSQALLGQLVGDGQLNGLCERAQQFLGDVFSEDKVQHVNTTDGVRISLVSGRIVHFRPSGNAPELRCYVEADDVATAEALLVDGMECLASKL